MSAGRSLLHATDELESDWRGEHWEVKLSLLQEGRGVQVADCSRVLIKRGLCLVKRALFIVSFAVNGAFGACHVKRVELPERSSRGDGIKFLSSC